MVRFVGAEKGQVRAMVVPPQGAHSAAHLMHKGDRRSHGTLVRLPSGRRERVNSRRSVVRRTNRGSVLPAVPAVGIRCGNLRVRPPRTRRPQTGYAVPRRDLERTSNFVVDEVLDYGKGQGYP